MKGFFITFEGIEGTGKSTQAKALYTYLKEKGYPTLFTREPGGTKLGNLIRDILMNPDHKSMCTMTEVFLFAAARVQHVEQFLRPSLEEGFIVICDRYSDSTLAYQGYGREIPLAIIRDINSNATWRTQPNLTFYLDLEPALAMHRVRLRVEETETVPDRLEREKLEFFHRVRDGYLKMAQEEPHRFRVLDAKVDPQSLHKKITDICLAELKKAKISRKSDLQAPEDWETESSLWIARGEQGEKKGH